MGVGEDIFRIGFVIEQGPSVIEFALTCLGLGLKKQSLGNGGSAHSIVPVPGVAVKYANATGLRRRDTRLSLGNGIGLAARADAPQSTPYSVHHVLSLLVLQYNP